MAKIDTDWFKERMRVVGITQSDLAAALGLDRSMVSKKITGIQDFSLRDIPVFAAALRVPGSEIMRRIDQSGDASFSPISRTQIVGYVGAGAEVTLVDDHAMGGGLEEVDLPPGCPPDVVALRVRGDSMYPSMEDGWTLFYRRDPHEGMTGECVGRLCVVCTDDDLILVKKVERGSSEGLFDLFSHNGPALRDAKLKWCAPVLSITPHI